MRSRAGFSLTPAKSSTWARTVDALADRLALAAVCMERGDELRDVGRCDLVDATRAEQRQHASELNAMADGGSVGDVDPRGAPALRDLGEGRRGAGMLVEAADVGTRIAASSPATQRLTGQRVPPRRE